MATVVEKIRYVGHRANSYDNIVDISRLKMDGTGYIVLSKSTSTLTKKYGGKLENLVEADKAHNIYAVRGSSGLENWYNLINIT